MEDDSSWIGYNGQEYKLSRWYGDGIFASNPVRGIVVDKLDHIVALTPLGSQASGLCLSFNYCWSFVFGDISPIPAIWQFDPQRLLASNITSSPNDNYPDDYSGPIAGFTRSYNPLLYPVAWATLLLNKPVLTLFIFLCAALPVVITLLTRWISRRKTRNAWMRFLKGLIILAFTGATLLSVFFLILIVFFSGTTVHLLSSIALLLLLHHYKRRHLTAKVKP